MPAPKAHHTPLRRVSHGSLAGLARSGGHPDGPTGLDFLAPALQDFGDEQETLLANMEGIDQLTTALESFNESFATYLYAMRVNSYCVDWSQAPQAISFEQAEKDRAAALRAQEEEAAAAAAAAAAAEAKLAALRLASTTVAAPTDETIIAAGTSIVDQTVLEGDGTSHAAEPKKVKPKGKGKMTAKERKERNALIEKAVQRLPLEFRGNDPALRRSVEMVIEQFLDSQASMRIQDLIRAPELPQARVNKCLIAMVNSKLVKKTMTAGAATYQFSTALL